MDDFEQQLKRAMARQEPPAWFEAKVMSAAARQPRRRWEFWRMRWAAAALATVALTSGIVWQHQRESQERMAGEQAAAKLELALKITSKKLQHIEEQLEAVQQGN
jgi:hypothetical protein